MEKFIPYEKLSKKEIQFAYITEKDLPRPHQKNTEKEKKRYKK